eukprot:gene30901-16720_t
MSSDPFCRRLHVDGVVRRVPDQQPRERGRTAASVALLVVVAVLFAAGVFAAISPQFPDVLSTLRRPAMTTGQFGMRSCGISQFFILSPRGDKLIAKDYRNDIIRGTDE